MRARTKNAIRHLFNAPFKLIHSCLERGWSNMFSVVQNQLFPIVCKGYKTFQLLTQVKCNLLAKGF